MYNDKLCFLPKKERKKESNQPKHMVGFRVWLGLGFRVWLGLGFRVWVGFRVTNSEKDSSENATNETTK